MKQANRRKNIRAKISVAARVFPEGEEPIEAVVKDLSLDGVLLHAENAPKRGQRCEVVLLFGHEGAELPIHAGGLVAWARSKKFAIQFKSVGFADHEEIKSMVMMHVEDRAVYLKEFSNHMLPVDPLSASTFLPIKPKGERKKRK